MPKQINVTVSTVECDLDFAIKSDTLGKNLFDQICHTLGLKEVWYFGLYYIDNKEVPSWLRMNKRVKDQNLQKQYPWRFNFKVKLYPEDVTFNVIQDVTLRLFYLQMKELLITDEVYCPPETSVLLASYMCQEKFGDFDPDVYHSSVLDIDCLLPVRVIQQHRLTHSQWEEKIVDCWLEHKDQLREEAMLSYLRICQDLDMYGVNYFEIYNRKGSKLWLGIDALGINIYHYNDKLAPQIGFPWSEINNISYSDKRFTIQTTNSKSPDFIFLTDKARINKTILDLCIRNHELYITRRRPDSADVQQMKMLQIAERTDRNEERLRLKKEREARIAAEHNQRVLEQKLMAIEREQEASKRALMLYQAKSTELERKIAESEEQSRVLSNLHQTAELEMKQMEETLSSHIEEKEELREMYLQKEEYALQTARRVEEEQCTSQKLKGEFKDLQQKYNTEVLLSRGERVTMAISTDNATTHSTDNATTHSADNATTHSADNATTHSADNATTHSADNATTHSADNATTHSADNATTHSADNAISHCAENSSIDVGDETCSDGQDFRMDRVAGDRSEESREMSRDGMLLKKLKDIEKDLIMEKKFEALTDTDHQYISLVQQGDDKYKTLKKIRKGNTRQRVEDFEQMVSYKP